MAPRVDVCSQNSRRAQAFQKLPRAVSCFADPPASAAGGWASSNWLSFTPQYAHLPKGTPKNNSQILPNPPLKSSADRIFRDRSRLDLGSDHLGSISVPPPPLPALRPPPLPPPSPSANARPALPCPSDAPPPSPEPPRPACAPRRRPERPSGPLRPASAPSAAATRVHRSRAAVMTGTPHGPTAPTRVATAVRSRVAPSPTASARPRFDPLRLTAPHNLLCCCSLVVRHQ